MCMNLVFSLSGIYLTSRYRYLPYATPGQTQGYRLPVSPVYQSINSTNIPPKFPHSSYLPIHNTQIPSSLIYSSPSFVPVVGDHQTTYIQAASSSTTQSSFLPDLTHVPTIPNIRPGPDGWKQVVRDWEHADPSRNHHYALRNWKPEWAKEMKLASIYNKRKLIATEFIEEYVHLSYSSFTQ